MIAFRWVAKSSHKLYNSMDITKIELIESCPSSRNLNPISPLSSLTHPCNARIWGETAALLGDRFVIENADLQELILSIIKWTNHLLD